MPGEQSFNRDIGAKIEEGVRQATEAARGSAECVQDYIADGAHRFQEVVEHNPASSVMVSFGIGLGVGVLVGCLLSQQETMTQRTTRQTRNFAENLGQRVYDAISDALPDSVKNYLHA